MINIKVLKNITCEEVFPKDFIESNFCESLNKDDKWYFCISSLEELLIADSSGNFVEVPENNKLCIRLTISDDRIELDEEKTIYQDY